MKGTPERPLLIGLVGETATGKSTLARSLAAASLKSFHPKLEFAFREIQTLRTRSMLRFAGYPGGDADSVAMRNFHRTLRENGDHERIFTSYYEQMSNHIVIIDAIRHPMDAATILKLGGTLASLELVDVEPRERNIILVGRFNDDQNTHGTPTDEKHKTETWEEAEEEVHGIPGDIYSSNVDATLLMVPSENRINANQSLEGVYRDASVVVARVGLAYLGLPYEQPTAA